MENERRESGRIPAVLYVRRISKREEWREQLGNVGLGGVGFEYSGDPEVSIFEVEFSLPGEAALRKALAQVVQTHRQGNDDEAHPYYLGLKFVDLCDEDEIALARALDSRRAGPN